MEEVKEQDKKIRLTVCFRRCFEKNEPGIRVLEYLSKFCLEGRTTFNPSSDRMAALNEGSRRVIIEIRRMLKEKDEKQTKAISD